MVRTSILLKLLLVVFVLPSYAQAQDWSTPLNITFDNGDTIYPHAVVIDTVTYHHNSWQIGRPNKTVFDSAHSLPNAIVTDTLNPYSSNDTSVFILGLRNYLVTSAWWHAIEQVSFYYQMNVDTGCKGLVEYSIDTGHTWHIASNGWGYPPDTITFSHSHVGWQSYSIPGFDTYIDTVLLRFTFISDSDTSTNDGWMIDDIRVDYWAENIPSLNAGDRYSIHPNPTQNTLNITAANKIKAISIFNILGQRVYNSECNTTIAQIDVGSLTPGLYFVNIDGILVGKFLKE